MACGENCACSPLVVDQAFREAEPFIEREIRDRTYQMARYLVDFAPVKLFNDGIGYTQTKVRFYGDIGPQFDGMDGWRREQRSHPADNLREAHDACGYVWEEVGHGYEELQWYLMKRDLRTPDICIEDIRTYWEYEQMQELIFKNLAEITVNMREQVNRNAIISFSVKYVLTSNGLETNTLNPRELPNLGTVGEGEDTRVTVGKLNFRVLKRLYNALVREAAPYALESVNGRPVFGLMASDDVLDDLFLEDPQMRYTIDHSSQVDSIINRYNFIETVRNMFITIPDMYAPRYKVDNAGNLTRVFPYERDVIIQSGTRPAPNPEYDNAPYELVTILTKDLFCLRTRKAITTAGGQTDFEAETGMFEWKWHNPPRYCDPNRRVGYYYANGRIGIEPGDFTDIPAILVARRPASLDASFWPAPTCPPTQEECTNALPTQGCPTSKVAGCMPDISNAHYLQFKLTKALSTAVNDDVIVKLNTGATIKATVLAKSTDNTLVKLDFGVDVECIPNFYLEVIDDATDYVGRCNSPVIEDACLSTGYRALRVEHLLSNSLVAHTTTVTGSTVYLYLSTNEWITGEVMAIDKTAMIYSVNPTTTLVDECIVKICVPTAVDSTCPSCVNAGTPCS